MLIRGNARNLRRVDGAKTLEQRALAILARYGSAANLYLPGVGAINGITAGNWLDSIGMTAATVDNPVGLVVSAGKSVGPELFSVASVGGGVTNNGGTLSVNSVAVGSAIVTSNVALIVGKYYKVTFTVSGYSGGGVSIRAGTTGSAGAVVGAMNGTFTEVFSPAISSDNFNLIARYATTTITVSNISVRELPGAHLTQSTAANRPVLRLAGGVYAWDFVSSDSFTSTMTPGNAGFFCSVANVTDSGVLRTLLGAGASGSAVSGVWLIRDILAGGELRLYVGSGTTRQNVGSSAPYPVATAAVASAGWDGSSMFVGINNTETNGSKSVNCTSSNTANVGALTGTMLPWLGTIGATIIMPTVLPTSTERAALRRFIGRLSGVEL